MISKLSRRTVIKSAGALTVGMPFLNIATAQASPVQIGVALPFTGNAGVYGPDMAAAMKLAATHVNDAGGILGGRKIELLIADTETSATAAANLTHKFVNVNRCQAITGYWATPEAMAARAIAVQNKVVQMVLSSADSITEGDTQGYVYRFQLRASGWGKIIGRSVGQLGYRKVGILGLQNAFVIPILDAVEEQVKAKGGTVVERLMYNPEQPSYRAEVERVFSKSPDAVYCFGQLADFVSIMKEVARNGFNTPIVALSVMADAEGKFVQAVGPKVAEGIRHFQPMPDVASPSYKRFVKNMGAPSDRVYLFAPDAYDQICVAALAMELSKSAKAADWARQIIPATSGHGEPIDDIGAALSQVRAGKSIDFVGAGSSCDFAANGDQLNRGMGQWVNKGGKSVFVRYERV